MSGRLVRLLVVLAVVLAVSEFVSAFWITSPGFAVAFGALLLVGAALVYRRQTVVGAAFLALLNLVEVANYPHWVKRGVLDWTTDTIYAVIAAAGLVCAIAVLARRVAARRVTTAAR
jgi:hypothetical protein